MRGRNEGSVRQLTTLLNRASGDQDGQFATLVEVVYDDLRHIAARRMNEQFDSPLASLTLAPTAIAHDAILELRRQRVQWKNGDHFFAIATLLIGRLVAGYQRHRSAAKRGGGNRGARLGDSGVSQPAAPPDASAAESLEAVHALERLHQLYPRKAEVVSLHVLCGFSLPKVAEMTGISLATAERDWRFARVWLMGAVSADHTGGPDGSHA